MVPRLAIFGLIAFSLHAQAPTRMAELSSHLADLALDPAATYRVRDVPLDRGDLRLYFTDGWLTFAKPIAIEGKQRILAAIYTRGNSGDDAEFSILPPSTGERMSLARFTGTPNLNEHLEMALMIFSDNTADDFLNAIRLSNNPKPSPEQGLLMQSRFDSVVHSIGESFRLRLMESVLSGREAKDGFFYIAMSGRKHGNFDALFDPTAARHVFLGQLTERENRTYYDVWTAFPARSRRNQPQPVPKYSIPDYAIDARLSADLNLTVDARATITLDRPAELLVFDLSDRLTISSVSVDGQPAEFYQPVSLRSNRIVANEVSQFLVLPGHALEANRTHEVRFTYAGKVITQMGRDVYSVGSRSSWYPANGIQFSRFDVTFVHPESLDVVFPGEVVSLSVEGGVRHERRQVRQPIRMVGFNVGKYESKQVSRAGLGVTVFANHDVETRLQPSPVPVIISSPAAAVGFPGRPAAAGVRRDVMVLPPPPPPDPLARLTTLANDVADSFQYFQQAFGPPALPELMVSPIPGNFGQGFPGLLYLSTLAYLNPIERPESARTAQNSLFFNETLQAHETAHQWWGNTVTTSTEADEWLMEALASYSSLMMLEKHKGPKALREAFSQYRDHLLAAADAKKEEKKEVQPLDQDGFLEPPLPEEPVATKTRESVGPLRLGNRLDNSLAPGAWQSVIYEKGAWVMHMLRGRMGEAAFTKFLHDFAAKYRLSSVTTEQFFEAAAAALPAGALDRKLEGFTESWVESTGIPKLTLESKVTGKAPNLRLTVTVKQAEVGDRFSTIVPVVVQFAQGKPRTLWLETGSSAQSETISVPVRPSKVQLDPEGWVLKR